jgi:hypothetical protein
MTLKFTHEATRKGYSFLAGEVHSLPDEIGELMILDGVAFQVPSRLNGEDQKSINALKEAKERDGGNKSNG